jgi:ribosomal protein L31
MASTMKACGSRATAFKGAQLAYRPSKPVTSGVMGAQMRKKDIHPEYFEDAPVIHQGQEVMRIGGTKKQYNVDIYSGNHPFYQGVQTVMVVDEGQLNKFKKRFMDLSDLTDMPTVTAPADAKPEPIDPAILAILNKAKGKPTKGKSRR